MNHDRYVVLLDFPGIKDYVFGTDRLVEIRGASSLLDDINRNFLPQFIAKSMPSPQFHQQCVFAGGGAAQFILDAPAEIITDLFDAVRGEIYRASGGSLRLVSGIAPLATDYRSALSQAFFDLNQKKRWLDFTPEPSIHCGFIRECDSCSGMASDLVEYAGEKRLLCLSCKKKVIKGRERGLWSGFLAFLNKLQQPELESMENTRPDDFGQIGDRCRSKKDYTALIYADGNAMGKLVKAIDTDQRFILFSQTVSQSMQEACYEALHMSCPIVKGKIPADILLLGGDDLIIYSSADTAIPFAVQLARRFEEKTRTRFAEDPFFKNMLDGKGLTLSLGIAFGRSHTPIAIMVGQAEELMKSAKQKGSSLSENKQYTPCCIDFHIASRFNRTCVKDTRNEHLTIHTARGNPLFLYGGPYTLEETENLLSRAIQLKQSGIPRSRLHRLGDAPFFGYEMGNLETLIVWGRTARGEHRSEIFKALENLDCLSFIPWRERDGVTDTPVVDLVSLIELTHVTKEKKDHETLYSS